MRYEKTKRSMVTTVRMAVVGSALLSTLAGPPSAEAGVQYGTNGPDVIIGLDDDAKTNPEIQPAEPADLPNQSLDKSDVLFGRNGADVLIGLLGSDVMDGGNGSDILIGGTEQGTTPNSDTMIGGSGNDVALWRGGDGSEAFLGGPGVDALILGNVDKDASNVPVLAPATGRYAKTGLPTADLTGQGGFCTIDTVESPDFGYEFLIRFFLRATGRLAVTMRTSEVEQVFCTSQAGGAITFADLTGANPVFVEVSLDQVRARNAVVGKIVR
jgi:Ca2+-binding RTX toxin-like protein